MSCNRTFHIVASRILWIFSRSLNATEWICAVTNSVNCARNLEIQRFMSDSLPSKDEFREPVADHRSAGARFELPSTRSNFSPPALSPAEYVAWCREMQRALKLPPDDPARRFASKTSKEFLI